MELIPSNLRALNTGYQSAFENGLVSVEPYFPKFCSFQTSATNQETYGWLGQMPALKEWIGDREISNVVAHGYTLVNKMWAASVEVDRNAILDDVYNIYSPQFTMMGEAAALHPDELAFDVLANGTTNLCYDGKPYFSATHPAVKGVSAQSNLTAGSATTWYLLCTKRAIKPLIFQERQPPKWVALDKETDENVFKRNQNSYGVSTRDNVGYSFWQFAHCGQVTLDATAYAAARAAMMGLKGDKGRVLNVVPDLLIVPPSLEATARALLTSQINTSGASNPWYNSAELLVAPQLA